MGFGPTGFYCEAEKQFWQMLVPEERPHRCERWTEKEAWWYALVWVMSSSFKRCAPGASCTYCPASLGSVLSNVRVTLASGFSIVVCVQWEGWLCLCYHWQWWALCPFHLMQCLIGANSSRGISCSKYHHWQICPCWETRWHSHHFDILSLRLKGAETDQKKEMGVFLPASLSFHIF